METQQLDLAATVDPNDEESLPLLQTSIQPKQQAVGNPVQTPAEAETLPVNDKAEKVGVPNHTIDAESPTMDTPVPVSEKELKQARDAVAQDKADVKMETKVTKQAMRLVAIMSSMQTFVDSLEKKYPSIKTLTQRWTNCNAISIGMRRPSDWTKPASWPMTP